MILRGDNLLLLPTLDAESVHTVVTSPPYYALRDYGVPPTAWPEVTYTPLAGLPYQITIPQMACPLGLEPTLEAFIGHLVLVFRQVHRVLREDGTCWVNLGDSYAGSRCGGGTENSTLVRPGEKLETASASIAKQVTRSRRRDDHEIPRSDLAQPGLKPKDLMAAPWRVALALQADGWYLRQDIIWHKPNPMPESCTDRCTKAHEYLFLLAKSPRYYFDADVIAEVAIHAGKTVRTNGADGMDDFGDGMRTRAGFARGVTVGETRNKRSVWTVTTQPFKGAHFATFPEALIEPCILAGAPAGGTVLDLYGGSGTTGKVATRLGRNFILMELKPEYATMAAERVAGTTMGLAL